MLFIAFIFYKPILHITIAIFTILIIFHFIFSYLKLALSITSQREIIDIAIEDWGLATIVAFICIMFF